MDLYTRLPIYSGTIIQPNQTKQQQRIVQKIRKNALLNCWLWREHLKIKTNKFWLIYLSKSSCYWVVQKYEFFILFLTRFMQSTPKNKIKTKSYNVIGSEPLKLTLVPILHFLLKQTDLLNKNSILDKLKIYLKLTFL